MDQLIFIGLLLNSYLLKFDRSHRRSNQLHKPRNQLEVVTMCIRAGSNELESVKNLMGMSLKAVVADALHADIDTILDDSRLVEDLHMSANDEVELKEMIADVFDGLQVNVRSTPTVGALLDEVVTKEFCGLGV